MTDLPHPARSPLRSLAHHIWTRERVWLVCIAVLAAVAALDAPLAVTSVHFTATNLLDVAPFLILSIAVAAYAGATGADGLIARAFTGSPAVMIAIAALAGGVSPFCSCGVIPLIAALLAMGVPLSAAVSYTHLPLPTILLV